MPNEPKSCQDELLKKLNEGYFTGSILTGILRIWSKAVKNVKHFQEETTRIQ